MFQTAIRLCHHAKTTLRIKLFEVLQTCQNMPPNPHFHGFYLSKHLFQQIGDFFALGLFSTTILPSFSHTEKGGITLPVM